jgi:hypothetical protein
MYIRDDIYYCDCCGQFYDIKTDRRVELNLDDYAESVPGFVRKVMADRERIASQPNRTTHVMRRRKSKSSRGFGKFKR